MNKKEKFRRYLKKQVQARKIHFMDIWFIYTCAKGGAKHRKAQMNTFATLLTNAKSKEERVSIEHGLDQFLNDCEFVETWSEKVVIEVIREDYLPVLDACLILQEIPKSIRYEAYKKLYGE